MTFKTASLTPNILHIVRDQKTEAPFSGEYELWNQPGTYLCRQCGLSLFRAQNKFAAGCGWPSFDKEITHAVIERPDRDGRRTEIICRRCKAHLGHVFTGEGFTPQNVRHCVNSLSLDFIENKEVYDTEEAIFAAGCFWGVEYQFKQFPGVLKTEVGYCGGTKNNPTYKEVCHGNTGHYEAVRVIYDLEKANYAQLLEYFFQIHDPTQANGQGHDIGEQYQSVIFYYNELQKQLATVIIDTLQKSHPIATRLLPVNIFWAAEAYHQNYCVKNDLKPTCHGIINK